MKKRLLVIGAAGVRLRLTCDTLPYAGEKTDGVKYEYSPDCLAGASAVCAVKMGMDALLLTRVGKDANGTKLISLLQQKGVNTDPCVKDAKAATSLTVMLEEDAADTRMICYRGAAMNLSEGDVEGAFISYPDCVLLRLEGSEIGIRAAENFAAKSGTPLFVCASDIAKDSNIYLPKKAHTFIGDASSVLAFTGIAPVNPDSALRAAFELSRKTEAKYLIFRMNNGCIYLYDGSFGKILAKGSKGHFFCDVFAPAYIAEYTRNGNMYSSAKFALDASHLWEACGETFDSVPTAAEVRRDARD